MKFLDQCIAKLADIAMKIKEPLPIPGLNATLFLYQIIPALGLAFETLQEISSSVFSLMSILDPDM